MTGIRLLATKPLKVLLAEDEMISATILHRILTKRGYDVTLASDGQVAFDLLQKATYDILVTDWKMPNIDGMLLIRLTREKIKPLPLIILVTSIQIPEAREYALESGADDFITKPYKATEILAALENGLARLHQPALAEPETPSELAFTFSEPETVPVLRLQSFLGVGVVASTGGPQAILKLFQTIPYSPMTSYFLILNAQEWVIDALIVQLVKLNTFKVIPTRDNTLITPGCIFVAPPNYHMHIRPKTMSLHLAKEPSHSLCRPSSDLFFMDLAQAFGPGALAIILTGIGSDGVQGAKSIKSAGGMVIVQDPISAEAPQVPQAVISAGLTDMVIPITTLGRTLSENLPNHLRQIQKEHLKY